MFGSTSIVSLLALASMVSAAPSGSIEKRAPIVYLAGDSTMATAKGTAGTLQGRSPTTTRSRQPLTKDRLGDVPPVLADYNGRQQSHRWPQLSLLHR